MIDAEKGPAFNPERIGEFMTKESLHPGLGSGALREALEKAIAALERIRAGQRIVGVLVAQDMEGAISGGRAALSLSSPIEPHEFKIDDSKSTCEWTCKCGWRGSDMYEHKREIEQSRAREK